jgi:hypothetical protein
MANKFLSGINVTGTATLNTVVNAGTNTDKFLVLDASGNVDFRTALELYNDLGIGSLPAGFTSTVKHAVKAGVALTKGQAVYVTGADGTNMIVGKASNASEATSSKTMGLIESNLSQNGQGVVITEGLLAGLDTTGATNAGDPVWLGVDGNLIYGLTNKPYAPAHLVFIGIVTRINANNGEIFVKVQNGFELREIHDVDLITTTPINGHILGYNGTLWVNKTIAGWLGYTPVTNARTLTINGTSYDLSADRSWTITPNVNATNTQDYTATAAQTTFTVTGGYTVGQLAVFYNGSKLASNEFTATNGTTFVLATACQANDIVQAVVAVTGGGIGGSGTTNYHSKWTASGVLGNSLIWDNGTNVGIGNTNTTYTFDVTGTGRFTSTLLVGGAATFSGTLTVNNEGITINRGAGNGYLLFQTNGTDVGSIYSTTGGGIRLRNATSDVLTINSAGNVGIGNNTPENRLSIQGTGGISGLVRWSDGVTGTGFLGQTTDGITYVHSNNNALAFGANGSNNFAETMRITSGRVGIGMTAPADLLSVSANSPSMSLRYTSAGTTSTPVQANFYFRDFTGSGDIRGGIYFQDQSQSTSGCNMLLRVMNNSNTIITSINMRADGSVWNFNNSTTWQQSSDIKIKENIRPIGDALGKICALNPTHFEYKNKLGKTKTGFIAQEFEQVFAGHVTESYPSEEYAEYFEEGEMMKSIDADLIPYLVKAIQEQNQLISELRKELDTLKQLVK